MLDPASATINDVIDAIENRDKEIRVELVDFVRGQRVRVDVNTPLGTNSAAQIAPFPPRPPTINTVAPLSTPPPESVDEPDGAQGENEPMIEVRSGTDLGGLCAAYNEDPDVHLLLDHFASRQRNQYTTEIDALLDALARAGTPSEKPAIIRVLRRLDALGVGRFVAGRRGFATALSGARSPSVSATWPSRECRRNPRRPAKNDRS
jgi:hypothetical protein